MSDRELLLMEAIRRLDTAYCQLWGMVCAKNIGHENCDGRKAFESMYLGYKDVMDRVTGEVIPLKLAWPLCRVCADPASTVETVLAR